MKKINKYFAMFSVLLLTLTSLFSVAPAFADEATTNTVTLHKILQTESNLNKSNFPGTKGLDGTEYDGKAIGDLTKYFGDESKEIKGAYFVLANSSSQYIKAVAGNSLMPDFEADGVTPKTTTKVSEAVGGLTQENGIKFVTTGLKGNFKIIELKDKSTYDNNGSLLAASKAVPVKITLPLVNKDGVVKDAHVYPKNTETKPEVDKNFDDKDLDYSNNTKEKETRVSSIGDISKYHVGTKILKGSDYKKLVWTDSMTKGLTFNKDIKVTLAGNTLDTSHYKVVADDQGFRLALNEKGLKAVAEAAKEKDVEIKINYSATVNMEAIVEQADSNDVTLDYSNTPSQESEPQEGHPSNQQIQVKKTWSIDGVTAEVPANVKVTFVLQEKQVGDIWVNVASETKTTAPYEHVFKGLDDTKIYRVVERVSGYTPEYKTFANGVVAINNEKKSTDPTPITPSEPKVVTYGRKFVKTNQDGTERLAGAIFFVKKGNEYLALKEGATTKSEKEAVVAAKKVLDSEITKYNNLPKEQQEGTEGKEQLVVVSQKQKAYNEAYVKASYQYQWVTSKDADNVVKLISNADGQFEITGLKIGNYSLEEAQAPAGYAKLSGDVSFEVTATSYSQGAKNDIAYDKDSATKNAQQVKNKKVSIPQTGGIGTLIFTIVGISLMLLAAVVMKKRHSEEA